MFFSLPISKALQGLLLIGVIINTCAAGAQSLAEQTVFSDIEAAPSCELIIPNSGEYAYAQLPARQVQLQRTTTLPAMTQTWSVNCSAPTTVLFQVTDLQHDTTSGQDPSQFGLGYVNGVGKIGYFRLELSRATVDSQTTRLYQTQDQQRLGVLTNQLTVANDQFYGWATDENHAATGSLFTVDMTVTPTLNSLQETQGPLVSGAELAGNVSLHFQFGI
ncbi:hypothetical protein [Providencia stuartii]|uniref:hypothetical protein n=1 Tax=Providencia stuartii TaxID=588 RepID=UPI0024B18A71